MHIRQDGDVRAVVMYRPTNRRGHNDDGRRVFFFRPHEVMGMLNFDNTNTTSVCNDRSDKIVPCFQFQNTPAWPGISWPIYYRYEILGFQSDQAEKKGDGHRVQSAQSRHRFHGDLVMSSSQSQSGDVQDIRATVC